jgi:hypothetical protein
LPAGLTELQTQAVGAVVADKAAVIAANQLNRQVVLVS